MLDLFIGLARQIVSSVVPGGNEAIEAVEALTKTAAIVRTKLDGSDQAKLDAQLAEALAGMNDAIAGMNRAMNG